MKLTKKDLPPALQTFYNDLVIYKADQKGASTIVIILSEPKVTHVWRRSGKQWTIENQRDSDSVKRERREDKRRKERTTERKKEKALKGGL